MFFFCLLVELEIRMISKESFFLFVKRILLFRSEGSLASPQYKKKNTQKTMMGEQ